MLRDRNINLGLENLGLDLKSLASRRKFSLGIDQKLLRGYWISVGAIILALDGNGLILESRMYLRWSR